MAQMDTKNSENSGRNKPTRQMLRVDFTPMVDMNMLLITFFMFCTTLSLPQVMDVVMPADADIDVEPPKISNHQAITLLLGKDNKVYYYEGMPNYEDYTSLKETSFAATGGIRDIILAKNQTIVKGITELKQQRNNKSIADDVFKQRVKDIKNSKEGTVVMIKATPESTYADLIAALDEMAICSIGRYAIVDVAEGDKYLLENYETKGLLTAHNLK